MKNKKAITYQFPIRVKANISNFMAKFHQTFKEEIMMSSYSIFKKKLRKNTQNLTPTLSHYQSQTLKLKKKRKKILFGKGK